MGKRIEEKKERKKERKRGRERGYKRETKEKVQIGIAADARVKNRNVSGTKSATNSDWLEETETENPFALTRNRK